MSESAASERTRKSSTSARRVKVGKLFPDLPKPARNLLAEQPSLLSFLLQCQRDLETGVISPREFSRLAERWSEKLPRRRGAIIYRLQDFMEPELDLGLPKTPRKQTHHKGLKKTPDKWGDYPHAVISTAPTPKRKNSHPGGS